MEKYEARQIIECLRSRVTSRHLGSIFSYGREAALKRVGRDLERVQSDGYTLPLVVKGNFGNGKTHFLNIIARQAEEQNFAVSFVPLSKETPFDKMDRLYRRAAAGLYLPGHTQLGFLSLLETLRPGSQESNGLLKYTACNLHPKLESVLKNYLEGSGDAYNLYMHGLHPPGFFCCLPGTPKAGGWRGLLLAGAGGPGKDSRGGAMAEAGYL